MERRLTDTLEEQQSKNKMATVAATYIILASNNNSFDASFATRITGIYADIKSLYELPGITGLGDESISVEDTSLSTAELDSLISFTTGTIDAPSVTTVTGAAADINSVYAANSSGRISGFGNEDVTLTDSSLSASILNTLNTNTTGIIDASNITTLNGTADDINTAYASNSSGSISGLSDEDVTLTDTSLNASVLNTLEGNTTGIIDASNITTLNGTADDINTAYASNSSGSISGLSDEDVTLTDSSLSASVLNTLNTNTTGIINAGSVTTLSGNADDLITAYAAHSSGEITGLGNEDITLSDTTLNASILNELDKRTTGTIDASRITTLSGTTEERNIALSATGIIGLNITSITLTEDTINASDLNTLNNNTAATIDATNITTLEGDAADISTAYLANGSGITGLGDEDITLSNTTLEASVLNTLDSNTTGTIDASNITTLNGNADDINTAYASNSSGSISGLGNEDITLSDTSLNASVLNSLDANTTGIIDASNITTLNGTADDINTAYASNSSGSISGLSDEDVTLTDTSLSASVLNTLNTNTTGIINAGSVTTLSGNADDLITAYAAHSSGEITSLGDEDITLTDTSLDASALNTLDSNTSGAIDASSITTLTGTAADLISVYASTSISGLNSASVHVNGGVATTAEANTLAAATIGIVTATLSDGDLATLAALTETGNAYNITITDTTVDADDLNILNQTTTVDIDAQSITTIRGSVSEIANLYTSIGISGLGNELLIFTIANIEAVDLNEIDNATTRIIDGSGIESITGTAADISTALNSIGITGLGNANAILTDTSLSASVLNTLDAHTSGTINATSITTLTGAAADVNSAYSANGSGITGLGNEAVTLSDTTLAASVLNTLDSNTSGTIDATSITTLTGAAADINSAYSANGSGITGLGNEAVTLSDTTLAASVLNTLDGNTSGIINASSITSLSGSAAEVLTSRQSAGIIGLRDENGRPSIALFTSSTSLKAGETATLTFILSDVVVDFTADDLSISGGLVDSFAGSGSTYTATFIPTANSAANGVISVGNNAFSSSGIFNEDGDDWNNSITLSIDTVRPSIALSSDLTSLKAGQTATVYFTLSKSSTDFSASDLSISGGSLSNFSGSGTSYSATFIPNTNSTQDGVISVASGVFSDSAGNTNIDGSESNNFLTLFIDTIRPSIALSSDLTSLKAGQTATVYFTLSKSSTDFSASDLSISGGSLSNFSGSGTSYSATFIPNTNSTQDGVISVASGVFSDSAGNTNIDGSDSNNSLTLSIDTSSDKVYLHLQSRLKRLKTAITLATTSVATSASELAELAKKGITLASRLMQLDQRLDSSRQETEVNITLDLASVAPEITLADNNKRSSNTKFTLYNIDDQGALSPFNYNPITRTGGSLYDIDGDGLGDVLSISYRDGGTGDLDSRSNGYLSLQTTAATVGLDPIFSSQDNGLLTLADPENSTVAAVLYLQASLTSRSSTTHSIGYIIVSAGEERKADAIPANLDQLKNKAVSLFHSLEATDVTMHEAHSLNRSLLLLNGQSIRFFSTANSSLSDLSSLSDPRFSWLDHKINTDGSISISGEDEIDFLLTQHDVDPGIGALIAKQQDIACSLDFTTFTEEQTVSGTLYTAREADLDSLTGFYRTVDTEGSVLDAYGSIIAPGEDGYAAAALLDSNIVTTIDNITVADNQVKTADFELTEFSHLAPYTKVNGNIFFAYPGANPDGLSHFKTLGDNLFGLEDTIGGGDLDYDDLIIGFTFKNMFTT
ncbi:Ig-like domain-containing protein [Synechococcus sp. LTW-G]